MTIEPSALSPLFYTLEEDFDSVIRDLQKLKPEFCNTTDGMSFSRDSTRCLG